MTVAEFKAAFPVFADVDNAVVTRHIAAALPYCDAARWEGFYAEGLGCRVAHTIAIENTENASGVTSRAGDWVSKTMGSPALQQTMSRDSASVGLQIRKPVLTTKWGQRFQELRLLVGKGAQAV